MGLWQKSCHSPISRINVVPSAASSEISRNFSKIWETIFINLFLLLETDHFCNTIFLKRCSKACICGGNKPSQTKNRRSYFCLAVLITWCRTAFSQPLSLNGVLLPTPRSQVTISNKHEKLFFEIAPCASELNGRLTTSQ